MLDQNFIASSIIKTKDFIYEDKGPYLINPQEAKIIKRINLNTTRTIINSLKHLNTTYQNYCKRYTSNTFAKSINNWALINKEFNHASDASHFCEKTFYGKLMEIRSNEDLLKAFNLMNTRDFMVHANVEYDENIQGLRFLSDKSPIKNHNLTLLRPGTKKMKPSKNIMYTTTSELHIQYTLNMMMASTQG